MAKLSADFGNKHGIIAHFKKTECMCFMVIDMVQRKTLVLDLDETLIHSHHDGVLRQTVKPGTPPDFVLKVSQLLKGKCICTFNSFLQLNMWMR